MTAIQVAAELGRITGKPCDVASYHHDEFAGLTSLACDDFQFAWIRTDELPTVGAALTAVQPTGPEAVALPRMLDGYNRRAIGGAVLSAAPEARVAEGWGG